MKGRLLPPERAFSQGLISDSPAKVGGPENAFAKNPMEESLSVTRLLNNIRVAENLEEVVPLLNSRCSAGDDDSIITLSCTNAVADEINHAEQIKLDGTAKVYNGEITGKFVVEEERLPSPLNLALKVGAQVMFTKNDETRRWVNGSMGRVVELLEKSIKVEMIGTTESLVYDVLPVEWESYKYEYCKVTEKIAPEVAGKYVQFPLILAWAVTIHKSQGKTLEKARVDLGTGVFASGQVYVALSRCRLLGDITLARPIEITDVKCDQTILRFIQRLTENHQAE